MANFRGLISKIKLNSIITDKSFSRLYSTSILVKSCENYNQKQVFQVNSTTSRKSSLVSIRNYCQATGDNKTQKTSAQDPLEEFRQREIEREEEFNKSEPTPVAEETVDEETDDEATESVKKRILEAALPFVEVEGWSRNAIIKGAETAGYPGVVHGMFPNGEIDLIHYFYVKSNDNLVEQMKTKTTGTKKADVPKEFITWAIKTRLTMIIPYIKTWPQALATMSLPPNIPKSLGNFQALADDICYYSGDRSVDINWYARRIGVGGIYKATELYMLQDSSIDYENTWKFLERRVEDASFAHEVLMQTGEIANNLQHGISTGIETARNILGLNYNRR